MKHTIYCLLLLMPLLACSQRDTTNVEGIAIKDEFKQLKNFDHEPIYQIKVNTAYSFTVLINGIPIANKYVNYLNHYFTGINSCIPGKGEQKIEIQIYPRYVDEQTQNPSLEQDIGFELIIEQTAWEGGALVEPTVIYSYRLPDGDYSGQTAFVHSDVFTADVPYALIDWRKGRTFNEQDTTVLKAKAMQVYEQLISYYENRQGADYVNALGQGLFNLYQSSYFN